MNKIFMKLLGSNLIHDVNPSHNSSARPSGASRRSSTEVGVVARSIIGCAARPSCASRYKALTRALHFLACSSERPKSVSRCHAGRIDTWLCECMKYVINFLIMQYAPSWRSMTKI